MTKTDKPNPYAGAEAIWINARDRKIELVTLQDHGDLNRMVGGYLEGLWEFPTADMMYGDSEGRNKKLDFGFWMAGTPWPDLCGNALIVGREFDDPTRDEGWRMSNVRMTVQRIGAAVRWLSLTNSAASAHMQVQTFESLDDILSRRRMIQETSWRSAMDNNLYAIKADCAKCRKTVTAPFGWSAIGQPVCVDCMPLVTT